MGTRKKNPDQLELLGLLHFITHFRHVYFLLWIPLFYIKESSVYIFTHLGLTVYSFFLVLKILFIFCL